MVTNLSSDTSAVSVCSLNWSVHHFHLKRSIAQPPIDIYCERFSVVYHWREPKKICVISVETLFKSPWLMLKGLAVKKVLLFTVCHCSPIVEDVVAIETDSKNTRHILQFILTRSADLSDPIVVCS